MIKDVYSWELSDREEKVVVKHCSRSTTEDMKTYIQLPLKRDPDQVIIHVGTNDLRSRQDPKTIAKNITDIAKSSKTNKNEILVSSIVPRWDNLNGKGYQVNCKNCVENNFAYMNHDNISHNNIAIIGVFIWTQQVVRFYLKIIFSLLVGKLD